VVRFISKKPIFKSGFMYKTSKCFHVVYLTIKPDGSLGIADAILGDALVAPEIARLQSFDVQNHLNGVHIILLFGERVTIAGDNHFTCSVAKKGRTSRKFEMSNDENEMR